MRLRAVGSAPPARRVRGPGEAAPPTELPEPSPPLAGVRERGQAAPALVMILVVTMVVLVVATRLGERLNEGAQAQTAADAAALAGAAEGRAAAEALASANGGVIIGYAETPLDGSETVHVSVEVRVGGAVRAARAARSVVWDGGP